jgi:hypothetical protein
MHGSRWRREETRPVGPTRPRDPGASRRPYIRLASSNELETALDDVGELRSDRPRRGAPEDGSAGRR